ncbi:MAG: hypothetical protein OK404_00420 [Thaumarchaeota archaeon]|nr:hypothetical protein [Nitrososphaerota archaeon]
MSKMSVETCQPKGRKTYYVFGSGLLAIPEERTNEIHKLKREFHEEEARRAILIALARRAP